MNFPLRRRSIGVMFVLPLLAICLTAGSALAQTTRPSRGGGGAGGPTGGGAMFVERLHNIVSELNVTDAQKAKLDPIFEKAAVDFDKAMQESQDLPMQERRAKIGEMRNTLIGQIKGELTAEQQKTFDEKVAQIRQGGGGQVQGQGAGGGQNIRRLREAVDSLDLTDEQKEKVDTALRDAGDKLRAARDEAQGDPQAMRDKTRAIVEDVVTQLQQILTPEQQQKFRDSMRQASGQGDAGRRGARRGQGAGGAGAAGGNGTGPATAPSTQPSGSGGGGGAMAPPTGPDRLEVGQAAPDFQANKLDGLPVQLASFQGKCLLLAFGSFSSPSFRQRALALEELRRDFGVRVSFLVIYTREAHPAGSWEVARNRDEQIAVAEHKDEASRKEAARVARDRLKLRNLTFALDAMDDAVARAYCAWPNDAAVLIGKDGKVLAYQKWFDAYAMREAIEEKVTR